MEIEEMAKEYLKKGKYCEIVSKDKNLLENIDEFLFDNNIETICKKHTLLNNFTNEPPELDHIEEFKTEFGQRVLVYHPYIDKNLSKEHNIQILAKELKDWLKEEKINHLNVWVSVDKYSWYDKDCLCVSITEKDWDIPEDFDPEANFTY